ncbi:immunoglobulin-binding protein 1 isoform X1 [Oryctolagus cuniculus]|uniref:immunoglobulin-binding protein 1 isoform X1 n=1 Tax=Oryctolagus cuniculus TaxID=9986 RepID=UPI00048D1200|nr:immunoglobulin-binding protein 1 isoform X1 [Oryctolagus cuniculus]
MAASEEELLLPRLPELFETSKQLLDQVEVATEPTGSRMVQDKVFKGLDLLGKVAEMLTQLDLFSRNEDLEEIASTDLKYLMVPAFQGALTMKQVNPSKRLDHLQRAREHFINYLTQCHYYHVAEFQLPKIRNNSAENNTANSSMAYPNLVAMASQRQAKIERLDLCIFKQVSDREDISTIIKLMAHTWVSLAQLLTFRPHTSSTCGGVMDVANLMCWKWNPWLFNPHMHPLHPSLHHLSKVPHHSPRYKQKKEVENRLSALKSAVESGQADDDCVREYYLLHLRRWIGISLEEIESIDQEIRILREKDSSKEASTSHSSRQERPPMKPFILTRNATQAKVFGAGYPSLATMTVSDWYDQHRKYGALPDQGIAKTPAEFKRAAQQQEDKEQNEEEEDENTIHRAREWDDWKDTHPRGYGNRQNMG